jgi:hypothetical protein
MMASGLHEHFSLHQKKAAGSLTVYERQKAYVFYQE